MSAHELPPPEDVVLATVIPLAAPSRDRSVVPPEIIRAHPAGSSPRPDRPDPAPALEILRRRAGERWAELPPSSGRPALRAETVLAADPAGIDALTTGATAATQRAAQVLAAAAAMIDLLEDEVVLLSEALSVDLGSLRFDRLHEVADAVVALSTAPPSNPAWASPPAAAAAQVVLAVSAADLRAAAASHRLLYDLFTDGVWDVPASLLVAGRRRARPIARLRLRNRLKAVSRAGRVPGRLNAAADHVIDARVARARLADLAPLLAHHLGELDRGPLSDIDDALRALAAVQRLQVALGELLDTDRVELLLLADAFRSYEVVGPANAIRATLEAWAGDVMAAGGRDPWSLGGGDLEEWADAAGAVLPALQAGDVMMRRIGAPEGTLRALVDCLLLRERIHEAGLDPAVAPAPLSDEAEASAQAWSAS